MYYSAIGLIAVLILLIENQDILLKREAALEIPAWRVYRRFLFAVLAYYVTDILWGVLESRKLARLLFADTTVYFLAMAVGVLFWVEFTVIYLEEKTAFGQFLIYAGRVVAGLMALITAVNLFTPVYFTVDARSVYHPLPLRYVMLVSQILLLLLMAGYSFFSILHRNTETERKHRYWALALFGLIMASFLFLQLWYPYLPLYAMAYLLGTCLLHTFVVNEEKEEYRQDLEEAAKIAELKQTIASLLDNMPGMNYTKDAETGVFLACNQSFAAYARKASPEDVAGLTDAQLFDAETAAQSVEDDRIALSMDEPYIYFEDVLDGAGNQRQFQTTKLKYIDAAGRKCLLGISQDVTDMVRIQRENATTREAYEKARSTGIIYTHIAQTLARGYMTLFYVNLDSEEYVEYRTEEESGLLSEKQRGWHFFEECLLVADRYVHPDDRETIKKALDRKTLVAALDRDKSIDLTFRAVSENKSTYYSMRVSRMRDDDRFIILGLTDIDEQMKQRHRAQRMQEEQIAYARLSALAGDFLNIFLVDPQADRYREFTSAADFESFGRMRESRDFFADAREQGKKALYAEDVNRFLSAFTKENVLSEIQSHGIFTLSFRAMLDGTPRYVQLKAALVEEKEGPRVVIGLSDIDSQVRQEEKYVEHLAKARIEANIDALTGVKNRHAYLEAEERLNIQIAEHRAPDYAIVIFDVNDLKRINDTIGHKAGDQYIRDACRIICTIFKRSPVFRVGGDEFAVISQGNDYACIEDLVGQVYRHNVDAVKNGGIVIACGMAKHDNDATVSSVFERADQNMYVNKSDLKTLRDA